MRQILIYTLLIASLNAQDFESFLQESLQKSPLLQTNALRLRQADENAKLITRYKNPTLSLEASKFSPTIGKDKLEYRAALSQPIRLWGVADAQKALANAQKEEVDAAVKLTHADFIMVLSSLYASYKKAVFSEDLARDELHIAQTIADISYNRFINGTIPKVRYLQASLDVNRAKNFLAQKSLAKSSAYYKLMGFRGLNEAVVLDTNYNFTLLNNDNLQKNATLIVGKAQIKSAEAKAKLNANKLEWISLYGEFEKEPDQSIARVGVNIPLVIFNDRQEEKILARLEAKKRVLLVQNKSKEFLFKLQQLQNSMNRFQEIELNSLSLFASQQELLKMYEQGYKIANINLIELQNLKNQLIKTKENFLNIRLEKELTIIQYNYLTGAYNE